MKWFKPKFSVCSECGNHFSPVTGYESRWGNLCKMHRKPVMEKDLRKEAVISWASVNWVKLEPLCLKEQEANQASYNEAMQKGLSALAAEQTGQNIAGHPQYIAGHPQFGKGIGSIFGGVFGIR